MSNFDIVSNEDLPSCIEALLFVSGDALEISDLAKALAKSKGEIETAITTLTDNLSYQRSGLCVLRFGDKVQLSTSSAFKSYIDRFFLMPSRQTLSQSAIEVLAIVAYKQPVTKQEIEQIRGVRCDYAVNSLTNKGLIREVGRKETLGRPILYGTTDDFLKRFDMQSLDDLPEFDLLLTELQENAEV